MNNLAVVCPGQGAQQVGMGAELVKDFPIAGETFEQASDTLSMNVSRLCRQGPEEALRASINLQPCLLTLSVAAYKVLQQETGMQTTMTAGHSLGEYSALVIAGALDFENALLATRKRGELMDKAMPSGNGAMAAVLGLEDHQVEKICEQAAEDEILAPANYNCPGQVVISGHARAVARAAELAAQSGAKRVIPLKVSTAFHTKLMTSAAEGLAPLLEAIEWKEPLVPVVANTTARPYPRANAIPQGLIEQITSPVRWTESVKYMTENRIEVYIEPGPAKVLCDMIKRISPSAKTLPLRNTKDLKVIENEFA